MRQIKFRAWDKENNQMLQDICTDTDDFTDMLNRTFEYWQNPEFGALEVMQFTGLHDKNGKEIYEGDIMSGGLTVEYENGAFTVSTPDLIVIGNIYENPELLKGQNQE